MSDRFFGFGPAAHTALVMFDQGGQRSGRTARMLAAAGENDLILATDEKHAAHLRARLRDIGKSNVEVAVVRPTPDGLYDARGRHPRRRFLHPDNNWVQQFFLGTLAAATNTLDALCQVPPGAPEDPLRRDRVWREPRRGLE